MKKLFLLAAAAFIALSSCVKGGEDNANNQLPEGPAKLKLAFTVPTKATTGDLDNNTDAVKLQNLTVFVLNSANEIMKAEYFDCPTGVWDEEKTIEITTSAKKLIGIGNLKDNLIASGKQLAADVLLPYNLATLEKCMGKLEDNTFPDKVLMSGVASSITYDATNPAAVKAAATLELYLIPGKLDVTITDNRDDIDHVDAWKIKDVSILYSAQYTHYVKNAVSGYVPSQTTVGTANAYYYAGPAYTWDGAANVIAANDLTTYAPLYEAWPTTVVKGDIHKKTFYVLPIALNSNGDSYLDKNTVISIMLENKDGEKSYFPTTFSVADGDVSKVAKYVANGDAYSVNITLKGSATTGGGTDPETPITNATLTVTVTPKGWNIVNPINKVFGN